MTDETNPVPSEAPQTPASTGAVSPPPPLTPEAVMTDPGAGYDSTAQPGGQTDTAPQPPPPPTSGGGSGTRTALIVLGVAVLCLGMFGAGFVGRGLIGHPIRDRHERFENRYERHSDSGRAPVWSGHNGERDSRFGNRGDGDGRFGGNRKDRNQDRIRGNQDNQDNQDNQGGNSDDENQGVPDTQPDAGTATDPAAPTDPGSQSVPEGQG